MCSGYDPLACSYIGGITAALNAGTVGVIDKVTDEMKREALHKLSDSDSSVFKDAAQNQPFIIHQNSILRHDQHQIGTAVLKRFLPGGGVIKFLFGNMKNIY